MKRFLLLTFIALSAMVLRSEAQLQFNPQAGIILQNYTDPPENVDYSAEVGFLVGLDVRYGERLQFQGGAFYMGSKTTTKFKNTPGDPVEGKITHNWLRLRTHIAYNIVDGSAFKLRVNGGPSYDILLSAKDEDDNDVKDNLNSGNFSLNAALGVDISIFTADLGYSYGLTKVFDDTDIGGDSKYTGLYFTVGVILGSGKKK